MSKNSNLKRRIRARMAETGECYTKARLAILAEWQAATKELPKGKELQ